MMRVRIQLTFYVPPHTYADAVHNLKTAGFLDEPERSRVVAENHFGSNLKSAENSNMIFWVIREQQIYRIDHYLGKDTVNNILCYKVL